jgi:hypothetical protein
MKINEFNNKTRVDEIDFKSLGSAIKKSFTTQSSEEKVQSEFIKSYINTISSSLDSAIQGGAVSPTAVGGQPNTANQQSSTASQLAQSRQQKQAVAAKQAQQQMAGNTQTKPVATLGANAFGQMATQLQPKAAPTTSSTGGTIQQTPTGQTHIAKAAPIKPVTSSGANAFGQMATQLQPRIKMPGPIKSSTGGNIQKTRTGIKHTFEADHYSKLNAIFEGIINLDEQLLQNISDYVTDSTLNYLGKIPNVNKYESNIKQLANRVQNEYSKDKGKAAFTALGNLVYAITQSARTQSGSLAATAQSPKINQELNNLLAKYTPQQKAALIQQLNKTPPT